MPVLSMLPVVFNVNYFFEIDIFLQTQYVCPYAHKMHKEGAQ